MRKATNKGRAMKGKLILNLNDEIKRCCDDFDRMVNNAEECNFTDELKTTLSNIVYQALNDTFGELKLEVFGDE